MKREQLVNAIEKIEDRFISEAEVYDPSKAKRPLSPTVFILPAAAAASVAMIITVNSIYNKYDPSGGSEIDNYQVTSGFSETVSVTDPVQSETEKQGTTVPYTVSESLSEPTAVSETEIPVTGTVTVKAEESNAAAAPVTQKTERQEQKPETPKKTEPPVTERQAAPEPSPVTEAATEFTLPPKKPVPPVTTEERNINPEPPKKPVTTEERNVDPEPPSTTAAFEKEEPPVTTTELIQEAPGLSAQPLFFKNFEDISTVVWNYDLSDYPEYCHEAYTEMFERLKQDGVMYVPVAGEETLSCRNIVLCPYAAYEDIAVGCYTEYDGSLFQIRLCYADRNKLNSSSDQADYFDSRLEQEFEESWLTGDKEILIKDIGVWHCAYAFIDDEHYYIVRTTDSGEALSRFLNTVKFKMTSLS